MVARAEEDCLLTNLPDMMHGDGAWNDHNSCIPGLFVQSHVSTRQNKQTGLALLAFSAFIE